MRSAWRSRDRVTVGQARRPARVRVGIRLLQGIRLVAVLVAVTFGWRVSLAYLTPCVHPTADAAALAAGGDGCCPAPDRADGSDASTAAPAERGDAGEDPGDCSCPIDCSVCCGGAILHALPAVTPPPIVAIAVLAELPIPVPSTHRALADPAGILHVPRAS